MRQIEVFRYERHLSEGATEVLKQMTGLKMLRELVRLAEAKALGRPKGLARSPHNPKIVDPLPGFQLLEQPARPLATTGPRL